MSHFWLQDPITREWGIVGMPGDVLRASDTVAASFAAVEDVDQDVSLHSVAGIWVLLAPEMARVNGSPLVGGVRVLRDRDEIRIGPIRAFFSEEELPRVVPFPGADEPVLCPRCKTPLSVGEPSVRCSCGLWYHQSSDLPCWAYAETCSLCDQPTALDAGYRWSPETL